MPLVSRLALAILAMDSTMVIVCGPCRPLTRRFVAKVVVLIIAIAWAVLLILEMGNLIQFIVVRTLLLAENVSLRA